jgi:DNA-binding CsgD family transcriptional regulator
MPSEWVAFYTQANLIEMDPRIQAGFGKPTPLYWDRRRLQHIKGADLFFDQAEAVGLRSGIGFYMPGTADSEHYMVSFNSCKDDSSWIGDTVAGKSYIFAAHFHQLYRQALIADRVRPPLLGYPLTAREAECLGLLAKGLTNPQIARKMAITDRTVALHVGNILTKLDAANRTEAVVLAFKLGLITP